jgi:hypothetical protein
VRRSGGQTKLTFSNRHASKSEFLNFFQETNEARNSLRPVRPAHYADSFWCTYIISVAAASVAETATYPLDLTKTRLQIQGEAANAAGKQMVEHAHLFDLR